MRSPTIAYLLGSSAYASARLAYYWRNRDTDLKDTAVASFAAKNNIDSKHVPPKIRGDKFVVNAITNIGLSPILAPIFLIQDSFEFTEYRKNYISDSSAFMISFPLNRLRNVSTKTPAT